MIRRKKSDGNPKGVKAHILPHGAFGRQAVERQPPVPRGFEFAFLFGVFICGWCYGGASRRLFYQTPATVPKPYFHYAIWLKKNVVCFIINTLYLRLGK